MATVLDNQNIPVTLLVTAQLHHFSNPFNVDTVLQALHELQQVSKKASNVQGLLKPHPCGAESAA